MTVKSNGARRALRVLIDRATGDGDLTVCVQSALSVLAALAGGRGVLDVVEEGRVMAASRGDDELADLLERAYEGLEKRMAATARRRAVAV